MLTEYEKQTLLKILNSIEPPATKSDGTFLTPKVKVDLNAWEWSTLPHLIRKIETRSTAVPKEDFEKLREYAMALENGRRDLWGSNEELREKITALEKGQLDLQERLKLFQNEHSRNLYPRGDGRPAPLPVSGPGRS